MHKTPYSVRQGDVLLVAAEYRGGIPKDAVKVETKDDIILAYGEVTGHAHRIAKSEPVTYFDRQAEKYLVALAEVPQTHEEHGAIPILPREGGYQQAFQVEDFGVKVLRVAD